MIKLEAMIDKTFYYRGKPAVIKSFDNTRNEIELLIEIDGIPKQFFKANEHALDLFLSNFTEVEVVETVPEPEQVSNNHYPSFPSLGHTPEQQLYEQNKETFSSLSQMLLNDIEKVRSDPKYVPQAKQVCNTVNAIVNMTRLQMQLVKSNR